MSRFYARKSPKHKNTDKFTEFFTLLGSAQVEAAHKKLMKLTPGLKFQQRFTSSFCANRFTLILLTHIVEHRVA